MTRLSATILAVCAVIASLAYPHQAYAQSLQEFRFIQTTPFINNSSVSLHDGEGMAYVPPDDTLWLADDNGDKIYEVDKNSGNLIRFISNADLAKAVEFGGTTLAGTSRAQDLEALAYDPGNDFLYVFSGSCCPNPPTVFRLVRGPTGLFQIDKRRVLSNS